MEAGTPSVERARTVLCWHHPFWQLPAKPTPVSACDKQKNTCNIRVRSHLQLIKQLLCILEDCHQFRRSTVFRQLNAVRMSRFGGYSKMWGRRENSTCISSGGVVAIISGGSVNRTRMVICLPVGLHVNARLCATRPPECKWQVSSAAPISSNKKLFARPNLKELQRHLFLSKKVPEVFIKDACKRLQDCMLHTCHAFSQLRGANCTSK